MPRKPGTEIEKSLRKRYKPRVFKHCPENDTQMACMPGRRFGIDQTKPVTFIGEPAIIIDMFGRILTWYLPDVLSVIAQESMWVKCRCVRPALAVSLGGSKSGSKGKTEWRKRHFIQKTEDTLLQPGVISLSPGWFAQGNDVSLQ
jgi:hypothetical protein